ncbi:MAG: DUF6262 family protein [Streptosporangiaceae bacterium]
MTKTDNTRFLTRGNEERRQATRARARAAIEQLDSDGRPVTFSSVAQTARVSRTWLYRESDIHDTIVSLRSVNLPQTPSVPSAQRMSMESLDAQLDAARTEITRLRSDNLAMRDQRARQLGMECANGHFRPASPH